MQLQLKNKMTGPAISFKTSNLLFIAAFCTLLAMTLDNLLFIGIIILVFLLLGFLKLFQSKIKNVSISLIVISFFIITSDLGNEIRMAVNILGVAVLLYFFLLKYGFVFSSYPKFPNMLSGYLFLVIFSMLISSVFSINLWAGLVETFRQIFFFGIVYLLYALSDPERIVEYYLSTIIISAMFLSLSIIITFINTDTLLYLIETQGFATDPGLFNNQAAAGGLFAVSIPISFSLFFLKGIIKPSFKKYLILITSIQFISLLLTNSRAAISASIIAVFIILFLLKKGLFIKTIKYQIFLGLSVLVIFPSLIDILSAFFRAGRVLENTRYYIWDMAFQMIGSHPIFGIGPGQFFAYMYNNLPVLIGTWEEQQLRWLYEVIGSGPGIAHNFLIQRVTELGILGLITGILLPTFFLYIGIKLMKSLKGEAAYSIVVGIVASGIGLFFRSFFEVTGLLSYGWISRDLPFWLMIVILIRLQSLNSEKLLENSRNF